MNLGARIFRVVLLALLWSVLTAGDPASWIVGLPVVLCAAYLSRAVKSSHPVRVSAPGAMGYVAFFVVESVKGSIDVARRALLPGRRTSPHFFEYRTNLPPGWPRALFANTVSLLPGTLSADIDGDRLTVHALATDMQPLDGIRNC